ncbi:nucleotide exchange factor GrpE [bacterium]|nr:nucleotide exchange factor GrpE [bacterium]MBU1599426.1 nucleotide exchange factor GrpE [bacterium]MBU2461609.1 nucleotide exchange factor GrpE [bacterium]
MVEVKKRTKKEFLLEIEVKDRKIEEYLDLAKRTKADFENYKKQKEKEYLSLRKSIEANLILEFLAVFDSLERASKEKESEKLREGLGFILRQFSEILKNKQIERLKTDKELFSPSFHTAIATCPAPEDHNGKIIEELQAGFLLAGNLLRPAQVIVGQAIVEKEGEAG